MWSHTDDEGDRVELNMLDPDAPRLLIEIVPDDGRAVMVAVPPSAVRRLHEALGALQEWATRDDD